MISMETSVQPGGKLSLQSSYRNSEDYIYTWTPADIYTHFCSYVLAKYYTLQSFFRGPFKILKDTQKCTVSIKNPTQDISSQA